MSRILSVNNLTNAEKEKITAELTIEKTPSKYMYNATPVYIYPFDVVNNNVILPFSYNRSLSRPERKDLPVLSVKFKGLLREEQKQIKSEAISLLNKNGSIIIAAYTGFGKTVTSINIASKIGLKTLIISHRIVLIKQWEEAINKFCENPKVQIIDSSSLIDKNNDFFIINPTTVDKRKRQDFKHIGFVIVDECHLIMAEGLSKCMLHISPRYVLGLSATPYRTDGLNKLLDLYFGEERIVRKLQHPHTVYKVETNFVPKIETNSMGRLNWNTVLDSICNNQERNELIIKILKHFKDRKILVLCKRISQAKYLLERLENDKESVTSLFGTKQQFDKSSRILIGTTSKCGTGFDHATLDTLFIASDVEQYFIQFLGRVFRDKKVKPIIIDVVDNHALLKKHFSSRREIYKEHGGEIINFSFSHLK